MLRAYIIKLKLGVLTGGDDSETRKDTVERIWYSISNSPAYLYRVRGRFTRVKIQVSRLPAVNAVAFKVVFM